MVTSLLATNARLGKAAQHYAGATGQSVQSVSALSGSGNDSFKVELSSETVALRLNGETRHLGVDRQREQRVIHLLAGSGIAPTCRYWHPDFLVTDFLLTRRRSTIYTPDDVSLAETINRLHRLKLPEPLIEAPPWLPIYTIEHYLTLCDSTVNHLFRKPLEALAQADWSAMTYGLCHCDLNPGNILFTPAGVRFIDWEYSRRGPLAFDLAVYFHTHQANNSDMSQLLDQLDPPPPLRDIELCLTAFAIIEALWQHITAPADTPFEKLEKLVQAL